MTILEDFDRWWSSPARRRLRFMLRRASALAGFIGAAEVYAKKVDELEKQFDKIKWALGDNAYEALCKEENGEPNMTMPEIRPGTPHEAEIEYELRIAGPDDVIVFSYELEALQRANEINKQYLEDRAKNPDNEVLCVATVHEVVKTPNAAVSSGAHADSKTEGGRSPSA